METLLFLPYLLLSIYNAFPHDTIAVNGFGFAPNEQVQLALDESTTTAIANSSGVISSTVTVPERAPSVTNIQAESRSGRLAANHVYVAGYYPVARPSTNYILPGQIITFSGERFAPGETVTISGPTGSISSFLASENGSFSGRGAYTIPFSMSDSEQYFTAEGSQSKRPVRMEITVGTFYPTLTPESYYAPKQATLSARGERFAPGEPVTLYIGSTVVATAAANAQGVAAWTFKTPGSGSAFTLSARGGWSNTSAAQTVTLVQ